MNNRPKMSTGANLVTEGATAAFAQELAKGIAQAFPPDLYIEVVGYLVSWATAERAKRTPFKVLRQQLNDRLASSVAAGLDVGHGITGHTALLDCQPPGGDLRLV